MGKKQTKKHKAQQTNKKTHSRTKGEKTRISNTLCCCCLVAKSCPTLFDPMGCRPPSSSVHGIFQVKTGVHLPNPEIEPASLALAGGFLIAVLPGKPNQGGSFLK